MPAEDFAQKNQSGVFGYFNYKVKCFGYAVSIFTQGKKAIFFNIFGKVETYHHCHLGEEVADPLATGFSREIDV